MRTTRRLAWAALLLMALAGGAGTQSLTLDLPQPAHQTVAPTSEAGDLLLPTGPWADGAIPGDRLAGRVSRTVWRIGQPLATVDLMGRLRADVLAAGFVPTFDCVTETCGGFDFRYALDVLPEPDMHVDLGDFRFLAARRGDEGLTLLVSRSPDAAYVQIALVAPQAAAPAAMADASAAVGADASARSSGAASASGVGRISVTEPAPDPASPDTPSPDPASPLPATGEAAQIGAALTDQGHVVLEGLAFAPGKSDLSPGDYPALTALAAWLVAHPDLTVALVGHTDATGGLAGNIALSRARAQSVRAALIALGVPGTQMTAEGMGYLAPRSTNLTPEGQAQNRRVEVVLTSIQLPSATSKP
jgi:OOP family OmpA-OmpF porin